LFRTSRGAGLGAILSATVHILLHCSLLIVEALTGEVVELQKPAGFHYHIGAGVTRDGIVRDSLKGRKDLSFKHAEFSRVKASVQAQVLMENGYSASKSNLP